MAELLAFFFSHLLLPNRGVPHKTTMKINRLNGTQKAFANYSLTAA